LCVGFTINEQADHRWPACFGSVLEWQIVVHVGFGGGAGRGLLFYRIVFLIVLLCATVGLGVGVEEDKLFSLDLRGVTLDAVIISRAGLQRPLDIDAGSLFCVLSNDLRGFVPEYDPVPFGFLDRLSGRFVLVFVAGRDAEITNGAPGGSVL